MSALSSSSCVTSRRGCGGVGMSLPARNVSSSLQQQRQRVAPTAARGPSRGVVQVHASNQYGPELQPFIMKAMAGISAGVLMFQGAPAIIPSSAHAAPAATLTEMQFTEAEKLYNIIRDRTGKELPTLTSSPNAEMQSASRAPAANQDAIISQLKGQLERMNQLLAAEKQLVQADQQEFNRLKEDIARMRMAEAMAPVMAAAPVAAPPVLVEAVAPAPVMAAAAAPAAPPPAAAAGFQIPTTELNAQLNLLSGVGIGGLGLYAAVQQYRAKHAKDQLDTQQAAEEKRMAIMEAKAAKLREELAKEQAANAQLKQQMEQAEQRSRLTVTSEKRQRELALRANDQAKKSLEEERKRILTAKFEVIAAREKAQATVAANEAAAQAKLKKAIEREQQLSRLLLTSAKREKMLEEQTSKEAKQMLEAERLRVLATKQEVFAVRERAAAKLTAQEQELKAQMEQAVEKEKQMGRLWLTSAKRENMLALRTNEEVKKQAEQDRKRMLATKMEIIDVRERAHASLLAKEAEMTAKMEQAVEKEKQMGRLWLTSAKRESMMALRTNEEIKKQAETDRKRMLATKMEIIDVREKAHASLIAKEQEMTVKLEQAVEKEKQMGRLWLTSAKRESMMALRTNEELKKQAETDRKRMLATKMEIIEVRERAHASLVAKEQELTAKMEQAVDKEKQLGRLWLTSSKRENMMAARSLEEAKQALATDKKRMVAAKLDAIAAREQAQAEKAAIQAAAAARLQEAIEREQQRTRLIQASAKREQMLMQREAEAAKKAAEADRKRLLAAKSEVLSTMERAQADRLAIEKDMMAKMQAEVEKVQQVGRLSVASERRQVVEARRAVAEATKTLETERKQRIAARSEALATKEQVQAAVAEVERLQQLMQRNGLAAPKAVTQVQGQELIKLAGKDTVSLPAKQPAAAFTELEAARGQVQAATSQLSALQQQVEKRRVVVQRLQGEVEVLAGREQQAKALLESLEGLATDSAKDEQAAAAAAQLPATIEFAQRKATTAAATTEAARSQLAAASQQLSAATADAKAAEAARDAAARRVSELEVAVQLSIRQANGYRSDEEEAKAEVAELQEKAKRIAMANSDRK